MSLLFTAMSLSATLTSAKNCDTSTKPQLLRLTTSSAARSNLKNPVDVSFALEGHLLKARFVVRNPQIYDRPVLNAGQYPFHFDVVELFVSVAGRESGGLPYYEFQVSPNNQTFQVQILPPRQFINGLDFGLTTSAAKVPGGWIGEMEIPLDRLGWDGDVTKIIGDAHAIQGKGKVRTFWSLSLPLQKKADFHKPMTFQPLFRCD